MSVTELQKHSEKLGVSCTSQQAEQLLAFNALLLKWTARFNLVSTNTLDDSISRHVLDALSISRFLDKDVCEHEHDDGWYNVLDMGSGAGLPVLPLAIVHPELRFVSVETNGKKVRFQRQVVLELGLKNVDVLHERIESVSITAKNVTSRAFTAPDAFLEIAAPKCSVDGQAVIMLGQAARMPESLPEGWTLNTMEPVTVPGESGPRHVAVCARCNGQ